MNGTWQCNQASPKDQTSANGVILEQGCTAELGGNRCLSGLHRDRQQPWLAVCWAWVSAVASGWPGWVHTHHPTQRWPPGEEGLLPPQPGNFPEVEASAGLRLCGEASHCRGAACPRDPR